MTDKLSKEKLKSLEKWISLEEEKIESVQPFTFNDYNSQRLQELVGSEHIPTLEKAVSLVLFQVSSKHPPVKLSSVHKKLTTFEKSLSSSTKWLTEPSSQFDDNLRHEVTARFSGTKKELENLVEAIPKLVTAMRKASMSPPFGESLLAQIEGTPVRKKEGGPKENTAKRNFAWAIVEVFAQTGQMPKMYRDGPLFEVLEICFAEVGCEDEDIAYWLRDKHKWTQMQNLSKTF